MCSLEGCVRTYRVYSSFRKHISRHHSHLLSTDPNDASQVPHQLVEHPPPASPEAACTQLHETSDFQRIEELSPFTSSSAERNPVTQLSRLLLKWKEQKQLPEQTVNEISDDTVQYLDAFNEQLSSVKADDFSDLCTTWKRERYWKQTFDYVAPVTIPFHSDEGQSNKTFEYIPIIDVIAALSRAHGIDQNEPREPHASLLRDVTDGEYFSTHPFFFFFWKRR